MKVLGLIGVAFILCGCSNEVYVSENGSRKCQYTYTDDYKFYSIHTNDPTNGYREIVITLKQVDK